MLRRVVLELAGLALLVAPASSATLSAKAQAVRQSELKGDYAKAVSGYKQVAAEAKAANDAAVENSARLQHALVIEAWVASDSSRAPLLKEAETSYRSLLGVDDGPTRLRAQNNLGVLLLRSDRPGEAAEVLSHVDRSGLKADESAVVTFNLGRALERSGRWKEGVQQYVSVVRQEPYYDAAVDGAFRVLEERQQLDSAAVVARTLIASGRPSVAEAKLISCLTAWGGSPGAQDCLFELIHAYARSGVTRGTYEGERREQLVEIARRFPNLAPAVNDLDHALSNDFPTAFEQWEATKSFPALAKDPRGARYLALLLRSSAESMEKQNPRAAVSSYITAWSLNPRDTEPALSAAALLQGSANVDREVQVLERLVRSIFMEKGGGYGRGDWETVVRMHLLLAGIFEKQGAWGDGSSPQSVVFQLQHAIQVQERSGAADVSSPGLHQRLGRAYAKVRKPGLAWNQFVIAADEFAKDENCEAVIELEEEARGLGEELGEVPAELRGRWDRVLAKCRS